MELSSEAQASSQCGQQRIQAQVPRAPWGDVGGSAPSEPPALQPPIAVLYSPRMGRPGGLFSTSRAPSEGKPGQDVAPSLPCLPCPHSPLSQVPSRCTTEPSNSPSVSLGPSSRLHLQGWREQGDTGGTSLGHPTLHPPLLALLSTCLCAHTSATPQVCPQCHNPP